MSRSCGDARGRVLSGVAALVLLTSCGSDGTGIVEAYGSPDSERLELAIDACRAESTSYDAEESDDEVVITITTEGGEGPECADGLTVELEEPLGDRRLVDGSTGEEVEVLPPEE